MTKIDKEYIENVMRDIKEALSEIKDVVSLDIKDFITSRRAKFAMRYAIILLIESAADIGVTILRQCFDEEAKSYREVFKKLAERGVLTPATANGMASLASLRNMIIHRYWEIDDERIYQEAKGNGINTIRNFIKEVNDYVSKIS